MRVSQPAERATTNTQGDDEEMEIATEGSGLSEAAEEEAEDVREHNGPDREERNNGKDHSGGGRSNEEEKRRAHEKAHSVQGVV